MDILKPSLEYSFKRAESELLPIINLLISNSSLVKNVEYAEIQRDQGIFIGFENSNFLTLWIECGRFMINMKKNNNPRELIDFANAYEAVKYIISFSDGL